MQPVIERFRAQLEAENIELIIPPVKERMSEKELLPVIADVDGVICGDDRFTAKVLQQAKKLKVISKWGTGIDSIDQATCQQLGIMIGNTPNAFTEPVSDTVMAYVLTFARQLPWVDRAIKNYQWSKLPGVSLHECTIGIIGLGNIGKAVARKAHAFGMNILANDLLDMPAELLKKYNIQMVSKTDLLKQSDFVTVNTDLNKTSFHLMKEKEFSMMKSSAVFINTSRGPVVDEAALGKALQQKKIAGAGLDVFEDEPLPKTSPLRTMDNVLLAPHNSNSSPAAWEKVHDNTITNLLVGLKKGKR